MCQLLIHRNSQCLKDSSRRVFPGLLPESGRDCFRHSFRKVSGCLDGLFATPLNNFLSNGLAEFFFAVSCQHFFKFDCVDIRQKVRDRLTGPIVESHIKWSVDRVTKSSLPIRQLVGRKAQVQQDAIDTVDAQLVENAFDLRITALYEVPTFARDTLRRKVQHHRITIQPDQNTVFTNLIGNLLTMPARSDGPINDSQPRLEVKLSQNLAQHDGYVHRRRQADTWLDRLGL